jgi:hypothetical protein
MRIDIFNRSVNFDGPEHSTLGKCHIWTGIEKHYHGIYGKESAHRVIWEHHNGKIQKGLGVRHKCDKGLCVNILHLELGTQRDNIRDMNERGRARGGGAKGEASTSSKLVLADIEFIRRNFDAFPKKDLSDLFGVCIAQLYRIKSGERWKDTTPQMSRKDQFLSKAKEGTYNDTLGSHCLEMPTSRMICRYNNKSTSAHRIAWMIEHGDIPKHLMVRHKCNNARCINHEHLELGTHKDNMEDRQTSGRTAEGVRHGMVRLTEDNVRYIRQNPDKKTGRDLAVQFNITPANVSRIVLRKSWKNV